MKTKLFSALLFLVLIPSVVFAARPSITSLQQQINQLEAIVKGLDEELTKTKAELLSTQEELAKVQSNSVLGLDGMLRFENVYGYDSAILDGVNVYIINGSGVTSALNGQGNLIIGYNVDSGAGVNRFGSHNIILGDDQSYASTEEVVTNNIFSNQDLTLTVANNLNTFIGANQDTIVGADQIMTVGVNQAINVGANQAMNIGANQVTTIGSSKTESVGQNKTEQISGMSSIIVGTDASMDIGSNMSLNIGQDAALMIGKTAAVDVGDELLLTTGAASNLMKKDGTIVISGKDIDILGSGGITIKATKNLVLKGEKILEN